MQALTRRVGQKSRFFIIDDSVSLDADSITTILEESMPPPPSIDRKPILGIDSDIPAPARSSRLKRRAGTAALSTFTETSDTTDYAVEPPLKKFKALFEESDPDRLSQAVPSGLTDTDTQYTPAEQSLPPSNTQASFHTAVSSRPHIMQEEEESTMSALADQEVARGLKRKSERVDEETEQETQPGRKLKKRAAEGSLKTQETPVISSPQKKSRTKAPPPEDAEANPGSQIGQPDVDSHFLKAIASMKKGKKTEDSFDREFNNLRISKPDLQREDHEKDWNLLADFGDEKNIQGNFMVVVEMDVYKNTDDQQQTRRGTGRPEWEGKPDFKKFRKVGQRCLCFSCLTHHRTLETHI